MQSLPTKSSAKVKHILPPTTWYGRPISPIWWAYTIGSYQTKHTANVEHFSHGVTDNWVVRHRKRRQITQPNNQEQTSHQQVTPDEENDAKLYIDMVESIRQWQERKQLREEQRRNGHSRTRRDEERVCYPVVGCFLDDGPFDYLDMLPSNPEEVNTQMLLYTRRNREVPDILSYSNISGTLTNSNFNVSAELKFIIHGFGSSCQRVWPREMRLSFLAVL